MPLPLSFDNNVFGIPCCRTGQEHVLSYNQGPGTPWSSAEAAGIFRETRWRTGTDADVWPEMPIPTYPISPSIGIVRIRPFDFEESAGDRAD